jgi:hypothetical protein
MSAFENLTLLAKQLFAGLVRVGSPPGVPGASSTIRAVNGSPEGVVIGIAGDTVFQIDGPAIWMLTGSRTSFHNTGWVQIAAPVEALAVSRQYLAFSGTSLQAVPNPLDFFFRFSANLDAQAFPNAQNLSDSIISEQDIGPGIAAQRLAVRAGSFTRLVMRASVDIASVQPWIEIAMGDAGPFVRTNIAPPTFMPGNVNVAFDITALNYPLNSRYRAGYTTDGLDSFDYDMQSELEITTPFLELIPP